MSLNRTDSTFSSKKMHFLTDNFSLWGKDGVYCAVMDRLIFAENDFSVGLSQGPTIVAKRGEKVLKNGLGIVSTIRGPTQGLDSVLAEAFSFSFFFFFFLYGR